MKRHAWILLALAGCPSNNTPADAVPPSNLASDEEVLFIPTFGTQTTKGWAVPIEAWVFEPEDNGPVRAATVKLVEEAAELEVDEASSKRIADNLRPFLVDNERGKRISVRAGSTAAHVCTSGADGRCSGVLSLDDATPGTLDISAVLDADDPRRFEGRVYLLPDEGVSVLSDVDDTIKITEVHDKAQLIENVFAKPPRATAGVPALYQRWAKQGAAFHYVSNSPLPLLGAIERFIDTAGYPEGSIQLKPFRWTDGSFLDLLAAPEDHKQEVIGQHIERFERRRFVLVGDTGERDPEIYAAVRRTYGERVAKIVLRDTGSLSPEALQARMHTVFEGIPSDVWTVFNDGSEVGYDLP